MPGFLQAFFYLLPDRYDVVVSAVGFKLQLWKLYRLRRQIGYNDVVYLLDGNHGNAFCNDVQLFGGTPREVYDATTDKWTAVRNADNNASFISRVVDLQQSAKGIGTVGAGQRVVVQSLTAGCLVAGEAAGVERGFPLLQVLCLQQGETK